MQDATERGLPRARTSACQQELGDPLPPTTTTAESTKCRGGLVLLLLLAARGLVLLSKSTAAAKGEGHVEPGAECETSDVLGLVPPQLAACTRTLPADGMLQLSAQLVWV